MKIQNLINNAIEAEKNNNISEAISLYTEIINIAPQTESILLPIALSLRKFGKLTLAIEILNKLYSLHPMSGQLQYEIALTCKMMNKPNEEIIEQLLCALDKGYSNADSNFLLADIYRQENEFEIAITFYKNTLQYKPDHFLAHFAIGMIYKEVNNFKCAQYHFGQALLIHPESAEVNNNIALLYKQYGDFQKALHYFDLAFQCKPDQLAICSNYVSLLINCGMYDKAIMVMENVLSFYPDEPEILNGLGNLNAKKEDTLKAKEYYVRALKIKVDYADAHFNLGLIMRDWNRIDDSIICFSNAIRFDASMYSAYLNLGETYQIAGEIDKSEEMFHRAIRIDPNNEIAYHNLLLSINYNEKYSASDVFIQHKRWGESKNEIKRVYSNVKNADKKIKIGFISPDFCKHPGSHFLKAVLCLESKTFDVFCYAQIQTRDTLTNQFKISAPHWIEIQNLTDEELCNRIISDEIDILVDCAGHMSGNRLSVFSLRPAPIQIGAFGYPCTTGLSTIDYRISDTVTESEESDKYYTESLLRMDSCFCYYSADSDAPDSGDLPAFKNGYITFGSLHTTARLNKQVISIWADILTKTPDSRLILFRTTLCERVIDRLRNWFRDCNINLSRIEFVNTVPPEGYLTIYKKIDCQLDTFPWSGHTTACESLWMGVPIITLYGDRHAGRMVSSVLTYCGMENWIAYSKEEYLNKACSVSQDFKHLQEIRRELRSKMIQSSLCNKGLYADNIGKQFIKAWKKYCEK